MGKASETAGSHRPRGQRHRPRLPSAWYRCARVGRRPSCRPGSSTASSAARGARGHAGGPRSVGPAPGTREGAADASVGRCELIRWCRQGPGRPGPRPARPPRPADNIGRCVRPQVPTASLAPAGWLAPRYQIAVIEINLGANWVSPRRHPLISGGGWSRWRGAQREAGGVCRRGGDRRDRASPARRAPAALPSASSPPGTEGALGLGVEGLITGLGEGKVPGSLDIKQLLQNFQMS